MTPVCSIILVTCLRIRPVISCSKTEVFSRLGQVLPFLRLFEVSPSMLQCDISHQRENLRPLKALVPSLPAGNASAPAHTDRTEWGSCSHAALDPWRAHAFSFLCKPITLNVAAVIFSYTTNMRAAVRTVCSSLASRPLYKPKAPYFLQWKGKCFESAVKV